MAFSLSSKNVFEYLIDKNFCTLAERAAGKIDSKPAKNFNLLVSLPENRQLLVKQEPYNGEGKTAGEFCREWQIQNLVRRFPELSYLRCWLPEGLYFDADNSILVFKYLDNYCDLAEFYSKENIFPTAIAQSLGVILGNLHRATIDRREYQNFFSAQVEIPSSNQVDRLTKSLQQIGPEIFARVSAEGLKFLSLYQRYDSLGKAIARLNESFCASCLTHNDLKLNNILLPDDWQKVKQGEDLDINNIVELRLIDWESCGWGDPACDLGSLIASYLAIWLDSLAIAKSIEIEAALHLALIPLEKLQPSLRVLIRSYLASFPEILKLHPDFLQRAIGFSGLSLIITIQSILQHEKLFNNNGICMLQVAKTLLCRPEASISNIFGVEESQLRDLAFATNQ